MLTSDRDILVSHGIDPERIPAHIAIIMDGNGRWAQKQGLPRLQGHHRGYQQVDSIVRAADRYGVKALTLYTFSVENWRRSETEVEGIMRLIAEAAYNELRQMMEQDVRVRLSGRIELLPDYVREALKADVVRTKDNTGLILNLAINYGGRTEIVDASRKIAAKVASGEMSLEEITEDAFSEYLYQPDLPDPDLLIRTAGELRISNFLLWQSAYAEIHVTQTLWPDFTETDLLAAIVDYQSRVRKFGGVITASSEQESPA